FTNLLNSLKLRNKNPRPPWLSSPSSPAAVELSLSFHSAMVRLSREQVLKDERTSNPDSITSLSLTHKALSDVSCLSEFKNLERLDLAFNSLTSLEGLSSCVNLKWLSVVQNKLQSLKGIESLPNLTVLNAGKNKLKSMDEVKSVVSLRALILNDNEIVSICKLDQLKELNTLVLSRNPIREIGESLSKAKSLTKSIGSSLKGCIELKELRLSHNEINTLPSELACNKKLQNLDMGNNGITRWSDLKVLSSLIEVKNLNLLGNPIADKDKLLKKVNKLLPNLQIFNSKPIDKLKSSGKTNRSFVHPPTKEHDLFDKDDTSYAKQNRSIGHEKDQNESSDLDKATKEDLELDEPADTKSDKKRKREKVKEGQKNANGFDAENMRQIKKKSEEEAAIEGGTTRKISKDKDSTKKLGELDIIDSGEMSFEDLFAAERPRPLEDKNSNASFVISTTKKKKKNKNHDPNFNDQMSSELEIGLGGPSAWGDE
ncbi:Protein phosphatase 1 regulatory subunit 7, partial [Linum perenne]